MNVPPDDFTAKARIRHAALELFARDGVDGTSMRSVAARAHVSPSLVVHHYGTKTKLRQAVDDAVLAQFDRALSGIDLTGTSTQVSEQINAAISDLIGTDRSMRNYLRRTMLEAGPASQHLYDALADLIGGGIEQLKRSRHVRPGADVTWSTQAVLFIVLGPLLLHDQLAERLGCDPFAPDTVAARSATNIEILRAGLFAR